MAGCHRRMDRLSPSLVALRVGAGFRSCGEVAGFLDWRGDGAGNGAGVCWSLAWSRILLGEAGNCA